MLKVAASKYIAVKQVIFSVYFSKYRLLFTSATHRLYPH